MKHCGQAKPAASVAESARRTLKPIDAEERRPTAAWLLHDARWFALGLPIVAATPWPALAQASAPKAPTENTTTVGDIAPNAAREEGRAEQPPLRVLVAEDHPVNQLALKTLLQQVGIEP